MSTFTKVPKSKWIAQNDLSFAIFARKPMTEGHTLVIPKREMETWFDASPEEIVSLVALIDEVKELLDERFEPEGYNIGTNVGEAAGQTVFHLHVHVLPRYVDDGLPHGVLNVLSQL